MMVPGGKYSVPVSTHSMRPVSRRLVTACSGSSMPGSSTNTPATDPLDDRLGDAQAVHAVLDDLAGRGHRQRQPPGPSGSASSRTCATLQSRPWRADIAVDGARRSAGGCRVRRQRHQSPRRRPRRSGSATRMSRCCMLVSYGSAAGTAARRRRRCRGAAVRALPVP